MKFYKGIRNYPYGKSYLDFKTDLELCACICKMFVESGEKESQAILEETITF